VCNIVPSDKAEREMLQHAAWRFKSTLIGSHI
jgi:hypothetical protein